LIGTNAIREQVDWTAVLLVREELSSGLEVWLERGVGTEFGFESITNKQGNL
jgi:hypothetical protein